MRRDAHQSEARRPFHDPMNDVNGCRKVAWRLPCSTLSALAVPSRERAAGASSRTKSIRLRWQGRKNAAFEIGAVIKRGVRNVERSPDVHVYRRCPVGSVLAADQSIRIEPSQGGGRWNFPAPSLPLPNRSSTGDHLHSFRLVWLSRTSPFSKRAYSSWQPRTGRLNEGSPTNIQNTKASEQTGGTLMTTSRVPFGRNLPRPHSTKKSQVYPSAARHPVGEFLPAGNFFVNGPPVDRFSLQC